MFEGASKVPEKRKVEESLNEQEKGELSSNIKGL